MNGAAAAHNEDSVLAGLPVVASLPKAAEPESTAAPPGEAEVALEVAQPAAGTVDDVYTDAAYWQVRACLLIFPVSGFNFQSAQSASLSYGIRSAVHPGHRSNCGCLGTGIVKLRNNCT